MAGVRAYSHAAHKRQGSPWFAAAVAAAAALVLGLLIGRLILGAPTAMQVASPGAGPSHVSNGVPVGYARSPSGAAEAVAKYQQAIAEPAVLRPAVLRRRIRTLATPDYALTMLRVNTPGANRIAAGPIGQGLRHGIQTLYSAVPIGYRVESYSSRRARILTWGLTLLGNASAVEPEAYFGVAHTDLVWREGDWKISNTRSGFGPTPRIETPAGPIGGFDALELAKRLKAYGVTP
jgi:hypothetical protein